MTLDATKVALEAAIADSQNRTIAMSGPWGTGKSFLWQRVREKSRDPQVGKAVYVSLFGVSDMATLKLKLLQSALPVGGENAALTNAVKGIISGGRKLLTSFSSKFGALDELAVLVVPGLLRDRFIVIDDIERKHEKFSVDEVLGFIDEYTQAPLNCRFLLILNTDQLKDVATFTTLREKVIDAEVKLGISSDEAFDIALKLTPSPFAVHIRPAASACRITNIRIMRRVIRAVNAVLGGLKANSDDIARRVVPSTVLLAAMHYKGIKDPPTTEFVARFNSLSEHLQRQNTKGAVPTPEDKVEAANRARWKLLMDALGIAISDEVEGMLIGYFANGVLDHQKLAEPLERYASHARATEARNAVWAYMERARFTPQLTDAELLLDAQKLEPHVPALDGPTVSSLHDLIAKMRGGGVLAENFIDTWVADFEKRTAGVQFVPADSPFAPPPMHAKIVGALKAAEARSSKTPSLQEVCAKVTIERGWGNTEERVMRASSPEAYEAEIRALAGHDLKVFLLGNVDLYVHRATYEKHFGDAMQNFVAACRSIHKCSDSPRLAEVIEMIFRESSIAAVLES